MTVYCTDPQIPTQVWEPDPERPGYSKLVRVRSIGEVAEDLRAALGDYPDGADEYLSAFDRGQPWPDGRIVVYAVNGSNEGQYVHVSVVNINDSPQPHRTVILGKTCAEGDAGRDAAWGCARRIADLLGA